MPDPTIIEIPHTLGREEARRRLRERIGELPSRVPGGVADVQASWPAEDRMALSVRALGQAISGTIDVRDRSLLLTLELPGMLGFMSGMITSTIEREGRALLLGDGR